MLKFNNVSLRRGTTVLFKEANFTLHAGEKVGLTGTNEGVEKPTFERSVLG
jgi:ATP-binding cassette subfamily F protein 3